MKQKTTLFGICFICLIMTVTSASIAADSFGNKGLNYYRPASDCFSNSNLRNYQQDSCRKRTETVYILGQCGDNPCYWVGANRIDLAIPGGYEQGWASSLCLSEGKVYICGCYYDTNMWTQGYCYWVGNQRVDLNLNENGTVEHINAMYIYEGKIYLAGAFYTGNGEPSACYWEGSSRVLLDGDSANAIFGIGSIGQKQYARRWEKIG